LGAASGFFSWEKWGNHGENAWEHAGNLGKIPGRYVGESSVNHRKSRRNIAKHHL
jgi:hypothetical protein